MKAIILAAGRGSRMAHLTDDRPKCLVEFRGRPLLDWQLDAIHAAGVLDVGIVTGYRREMIAGRGLTEFHNPSWATTNMVSSLACAEAWLQAETCLVCYADLFYEASAVEALASTRAPIAITYDPAWLELWSRRFADPLSDAESFRLGAGGALLEIGNAASRIEDIEGQYMGLLRFEPAGWAEARRRLDDLGIDARRKIHMTGLLQTIISAAAVPVRALPYTGRWGEIDSISDLSAYDGDGPWRAGPLRS